MTTRRQFLVSTIAASALPAGVFGTVRLEAGAVKIVSETMCGDGALFSRHCNAATTAIDHDPASLLLELEAELAGGGVDTIVGLTRPSTRFLIEQCAARHGCFLTYHGVHRYAPEELVHELHVTPVTGATLERRLLREPPHWARTLARSFDLLRESTAPAETITLVVPMATAAASRRHLVSWVLRKYV